MRTNMQAATDRYFIATLNLASFVTTYMEEEAEKLMQDAFPKNFIDYEEYPGT